MQKYLQTSFNRRIAQNLKKQWSAPAVMTTFIIICMIFIYSCESIGLSSNSKHLAVRIKSPEQRIKLISEVMEPSSNKTDPILPEAKMNNILEELTIETKHKSIQLMKQILFEAVNAQSSNNSSHLLDNSLLDESDNFYDI